MASGMENVTDEVIGEVAKEAVEVVAEMTKSVFPEDEAAKKAAKEKEIEEALNCPCIDRMKEGPCGAPFLAAYRCFLESDATPKGGDCYDQFVAMHTCIQEHPEEYKLDDDEETDLLEEAMRAKADEDSKNSKTDAGVHASPKAAREPEKTASAASEKPTSVAPTKTAPVASTTNGVVKEKSALGVNSSKIDIPKEKSPHVVSPKIETDKSKTSGA
eukprot:Plantae.Rhodophyta-Purpureofilum_apyrenoidigerum.ctg9649.p1 GENE.Plantae.Rhodophyta-Purpureofilum_apyrenoidigerum.ctg9649~~Plantae.Rhodophyta-Purpureofilum_apyrenoidigerum.ctg9649.p1  ORF type:complete len:216 (+),score=59.22 Plantae.Rhodophyta-Purpureofilum_apyrenoidigerum.ctg9649:116-763(+)